MYANVAVIDLLVVVVLDLHDLVARGEGPAEAFDLSLASGIEGRLQFDIERASPNAAPIHRAKHLDVATRVETEPLGNPGLHQFDDPWHGRFGIVSLDKIEVAIALGLGEIGNQALVDLMGAGDDAALRRLPEYLGQAHDRHGTRSDDVGEDLTRADGRKLVDIADDQ